MRFFFAKTELFLLMISFLSAGNALNKCGECRRMRPGKGLACGLFFFEGEVFVEFIIEVDVAQIIFFAFIEGVGGVFGG